MTETIRVAVLGASGYAGGELVRLLAGHRRAEVTFLAAKDSAGKTLAEVHPHLVSLPIAGNAMEPIEPDAIAGAADVVFSALPNGTSVSLVPALLEAGLRVIDLAGDFRLPAEAYPEWYGFEHPAPALAREGRVRRCPSCSASRSRARSSSRTRVATRRRRSSASHHCWRAGLIEPGAIRVDGKTGLSGAGKAANDATIYTSTEESVRPYRVPTHQHTPEMERGLELATGVAPPVLFVPHLVPAVRGVLTTCYATLTEGTTTETLTEALDGRVRRPSVRAGARARGHGRFQARARHERDRAAGRRRRPHRHGRDRRCRRQPREGRGRPGDPEPEPRARASTRRTGLPALAVYP